MSDSVHPSHYDVIPLLILKPELLENHEMQYRNPAGANTWRYADRTSVVGMYMQTGVLQSYMAPAIEHYEVRLVHLSMRRHSAWDDSDGVL